MSVEILLISEDDIVYQQTKRVLDEQAKLTVISFEEIKEKLYIHIPYDILIIDFNQTKVTEREFKTILDIKCRSKIPILALMEKSSISDQFEVLSMGALDFLKRPVKDEVYAKKINQLYKWKWYYDWEKKKVSDEDHGK